MLKICTYNIGDATSNVKCVKTFMQAVQHMLHHVAMLPVFWHHANQYVFNFLSHHVGRHTPETHVARDVWSENIFHD